VVSAARPAIKAPAAQTVPQKKRPLLWLAALGIGCLGLVCIGVLAGLGFLYFRSQVSPQAQAVLPAETSVVPAVRTEAVATDPAPTPAAQVEPSPTALPPTAPATPTQPSPSAPLPSAQPGLSVQLTFTRWALDYWLSWELGETDFYITDLNQDQSWILALKQPEILVLVIPPEPEAIYARNVSISVKVKPGDPALSGPYGVACHFQDENNYYLVEVQGEMFGIGKVVGGVFTPLTDPYWQQSQFIGDRDGQGFIELGMICIEDSIGVSINGVGEILPIYDPQPSFRGNAAALFGAASPEPVDMLMGIFYFKDLQIESIE
jgi:hypothetical protein